MKSGRRAAFPAPRRLTRPIVIAPNTGESAGTSAHANLRLSARQARSNILLRAFPPRARRFVFNTGARPAQNENPKLSQ